MCDEVIALKLFFLYGNLKKVASCAFELVFGSGNKYSPKLRLGFAVLSVFELVLSFYAVTALFHFCGAGQYPTTADMAALILWASSGPAVILIQGRMDIWVEDAAMKAAAAKQQVKAGRLEANDES